MEVIPRDLTCDKAQGRGRVEFLAKEGRMETGREGVAGAVRGLKAKETLRG